MLPILITLLILLQLCILAGIYWMWRHFQMLRKTNISLQNRLATDNLAIIQHARAKAQHILKQADKQSLTIEQQAFSHEHELEKIFNQEIEKLLQEHTHALVATSESFGSIYTNTLEQLKQDYLLHFQSTLNAFDEKTEKVLADYTQSLEQQTVDLQKDTKEKVQASYAAAIADIAAFKKIQMQQLQSHVTSITNGIVTKVLEEELDQEKQEKIVLQAIEQLEIMKESIE